MSIDINKVRTPGTLCECCNKEVAIGVASIPFIPVSIAWCRTCLAAGVIPVWAAVANTVLCGGYDNCSEDWHGYVDRTINHFSIPREEFDREVLHGIRDETAAGKSEGDGK